MRPLYLIIVAGLGILYYVSVLQREETAQVKKGEISEGDYMQEAPPLHGGYQLHKKICTRL